MRTAGVDLSVATKGTAAATIEWEAGRARVGEPSLGLDDGALIGFLAAIEGQAPWLAWDPGARQACVESDDCPDAVLCAVVARAAALGQTEPPPVEALELARVEGWIHLPRSGSLARLSHDTRS
jgi:hypothetical protein